MTRQARPDDAAAEVPGVVDEATDEAIAEAERVGWAARARRGIDERRAAMDASTE